jgi:hypothetical protein
LVGTPSLAHSRDAPALPTLPKPAYPSLPKPAKIATWYDQKSEFAALASAHNPAITLGAAWPSGENFFAAPQLRAKKASRP